MKKIIIITILICFTTTAYTQNLVPNPYFDNDEYCPWNQCQIDFAIGWSSYGRTPDYVHICATEEFVSVPNNAWGFQYPAVGDAYALIGVFSTMIPNVRELIGTELIEPLEIGIDYYVTFKVNLISNARYAINNLGVLFSTVSYSIEPEGLFVCHHDSIPLPPRNYAHIYSDEIISDTANWTTISGWFTADSAYKYLIIGNFFDDDNIEMMDFNSGAGNNDSGYFVDDVYVGRDEISKYKLSLINKKQISVYPNPFSVSAQIKIEELNIINDFTYSLNDITGKKITNQITISKLNNNILLIERNNLPNGMYFLEIKINNKIYYSKLLLTN